MKNLRNIFKNATQKIKDFDNGAARSLFATKKGLALTFSVNAGSALLMKALEPFAQWTAQTSPWAAYYSPEIYQIALPVALANITAIMYLAGRTPKPKSP